MPCTVSKNGVQCQYNVSTIAYMSVAPQNACIDMQKISTALVYVELCYASVHTWCILTVNPADLCAMLTFSACTLVGKRNNNANKNSYLCCYHFAYLPEKVNVEN